MQFNSMAEAKAFVRENVKVTDLVSQLPYTFASGECTVGTVVYHASGFSKCRPGDKPDMQRGAEIAVGRIVANIAKRLVKTAGVATTLEA
jgi:hypothetical protein